MQITESMLNAELANLKKQREQLVASLNQLNGVEMAINALLKKVQEPEPPEPEAKAAEPEPEPKADEPESE